MSWELLALTTALMYGVQELMIKQVMKKENYLAFMWVYYLVSTIMFFALFVRNIEFPGEAFPWIVAVAGGLLWAIASPLFFKSYELTDVSLRSPLGKLSLIIILSISVIFLGEALTFQKLAGTLMIFAAAVLLVAHGNDLLPRINSGVSTG